MAANNEPIPNYEHEPYYEPVQMVPETQDLVVCNAMDKMCKEVTVAGDLQHLDTVEVTEIPIQTRNG